MQYYLQLQLSLSNRKGSYRFICFCCFCIENSKTLTTVSTFFKMGHFFTCIKNTFNCRSKRTVHMFKYFKKRVLTPRCLRHCGAWLPGILYTPRYLRHRGAFTENFGYWLPGVLDTAELDSRVFYTLPGILDTGELSQRILAVDSPVS